ncbi:MAG: hypothetical protein GF388_09260 [Candidatus Aegiribacteria sp.]|nr:hypothetical protein [Candidatus Aegiribacteria sp.]MBD3295245.1 hypothetical protein [Candidatus Fermentibacteria bacterium]
MKFEELLRIVGDEPVFSSGVLLAGDTTAEKARVQLSRWVREGKVISLRRGCYALAEPYAESLPHPFIAANAMEMGSYVSCQTALAWYGLVPETIGAVTSITPGRPSVIRNELGTFIYRFIKRELQRGFKYEELPGGHAARVASPEKALLDLIYLEPGGDSIPYIEELRLQNTEMLSLDVLEELVTIWNKPKMERALENLLPYLSGKED